MPNRIDDMRERLARQQAFLAAVRDVHLLWVKNNINPEAIQTHLEIVELFRQSIETYDKLIDIYRGPIE